MNSYLNCKPFYGSFTEILSGSETETTEFSRELKRKIYLFNNSKSIGCTDLGPLPLYLHRGNAALTTTALHKQALTTDMVCHLTVQCIRSFSEMIKALLKTQRINITEQQPEAKRIRGFHLCWRRNP